jgi:hypothetical protein
VSPPCVLVARYVKVVWVGWGGGFRQELVLELRQILGSCPLGPQLFAACSSSLQGLTTTVDDHLLIIGDAAGHIDPLTGEQPISQGPGPAG